MVLFRNVCGTSRCVRTLRIVPFKFSLQAREIPHIPCRGCARMLSVFRKQASKHASMLTLPARTLPARKKVNPSYKDELTVVPPYFTVKNTASLSVTGPPGSLYCGPFPAITENHPFKTTAPKLPSISKPLQDLSAGESRSLSR